MINLLNPQEKSKLRAARRNLTWIRYVMLTLAFFAAINILFGAVAFNLYLEQDNLTKNIAENISEKAKLYQKTEKEAATFRKDLDSAKTILSNEITYSKTIIAIGSTVPSGCILDSLSLSSQSFNTQQNLRFSCKTRDDILRLKTKLESSTDVFSEVNIVSAAAEEGRYPWKIEMSVILKKSAKTSSQMGATQ